MVCCLSALIALGSVSTFRMCVFFSTRSVQDRDRRRTARHTAHAPFRKRRRVFLSLDLTRASTPGRAMSHAERRQPVQGGESGKGGEGTLRAILISCYLKSSQPLETGKRGLAGNLYRRTQPEHWEESSPTRGRRARAKSSLLFLFLHEEAFWGGLGRGAGRSRGISHNVGG